MVSIITLSKDELFPETLAFQEGVFRFKFRGDTTFIDGNALEWYWNGVEAVDVAAPIISGVRIGTMQLVEVFSLQDCIDNDETFFYTAPDLYIHYANSAHDYSISLTAKAAQQANIFLSNNLDRASKGYYGSTYYEPTALDFGGFGLEADPLKLGLIAASRSNVNISNNDGKYDDIQLAAAIGSVAEVLVVSGGEQTLDNARVVFKGFTNGIQRSEEDIRFNIEEQRFFYDQPICPNVYAPDPGVLDSKYDGKAKPVAFGDIRRGIAIPLDSDGVGDADAATITFQVADPALGSVRAITALYDDNGNSLTLGTVDLVNNTVEWAKPANTKFDLSRFRWEGEGYDLGTGYTYNNGVDIIRWAFVNIADLIFANGVFDVTQWLIVATNNAEAVGLSLQTTRGLTKELIEPISTSLQILVLSKGDGELTVLDRDIEAASVAEYSIDQRLGEITTDYDVDSIVSNLTVQYARDFVNDDDSLQIEDTSVRDTVINTYGVDRREPLSPVGSVLFSKTDAEALATEILSTSADPQRQITFTIPYTIDFDVNPFDMITVDAGRYDAPALKRAEVLRVTPNYNDYTIAIEARITEDIEDEETIANVYGDGVYGDSVYGG